MSIHYQQTPHINRDFFVIIIPLEKKRRMMLEKASLKLRLFSRERADVRLFKHTSLENSSLFHHRQR